MSDDKILSISEVIEHENVKYALVNYSFNMMVTFTSEAESSMFDMMKQNFIQQYGEDQISVNEEAQTITIQQNSNLFAVKDAQYEGSWKFLEKNDQLQQIADQIIPTEVQSQL